MALAQGKAIIEDDLIMLGEIQQEDGTLFSSTLRDQLLSLVGDPMLSMLDLREEDREPGGVDTVTMLVASAKFKNNPKVGVLLATPLAPPPFKEPGGLSESFMVGVLATPLAPPL